MTSSRSDSVAPRGAAKRLVIVLLSAVVGLSGPAAAMGFFETPLAQAAAGVSASGPSASVGADASALLVAQGRPALDSPEGLGESGDPVAPPGVPWPDPDPDCRVTGVAGNETVSQVRSLVEPLPRPDFTVHIFRNVWANSSQPLNVTGWVSNDGDGDGGPVWIRFRVVGVDQPGIQALGTLRLDCLRAGGSAFIRSPGTWTPRPGTFRVEAEVDPDGDIVERSEANNKATQSYTVMPGDLRAVNLVVPPGCTDTAGAPTCLSFTLKNVPDPGVMNSTVANLSIAFNLWHNETATGVGFGRDLVRVWTGETVTLTVQLPHPLRPGRWSALASIDPDNRLIERFENNNLASTALVVAAPT